MRYNRVRFVSRLAYLIYSSSLATSRLCAIIFLTADPMIDLWITIAFALNSAVLADKPTEPPAVELVRKTTKADRACQIVSQTISKDGKQAEVVFDNPRGIFTCEMTLGKAALDRVTFTIRDTRHWEGVSMRPTNGQAVDLKTLDGVTIQAVKNDCVIQFERAGLKAIKQRGSFQFIDQYR